MTVTFNLDTFFWGFMLGVVFTVVCFMCFAAGQEHQRGTIREVEEK